MHQEFSATKERTMGQYDYHQLAMGVDGMSNNAVACSQLTGTKCQPSSCSYYMAPLQKSTLLSAVVDKGRRVFSNSKPARQTFTYDQLVIFRHTMMGVDLEVPRLGEQYVRVQ